MAPIWSAAAGSLRAKHRQDAGFTAPFTPAAVQGKETRRAQSAPEHCRGRAQFQRSAPGTASCADVDHGFHATILVHRSQTARASVCGLFGARR